MPMLSVNGIDLPISRDSFKRSVVKIGAAGRSFSGVAWDSYRARKRAFAFDTAPMSAADADAWEALLTRQFASWTFESDTYSAQGHAAVVVGSAPRYLGNAKFGLYSLQVPYSAGGTNYAYWVLGSGWSSWTVAYWHYNASNAAFKHIIKTSAGAEYVDAVVNPSHEYRGQVTSGILLLDEDELYDETYYADDVFALPAVVPSTWPAQMRAFGLPLSSSLLVTGDAIGGVVSMRGEVNVREHVETASGLLWRLSVELEEV